MKLDKQKFDDARIRKCLTVDELRIMAKVSHNTIRKGYIEDISPIVIGRLARALEVDYTEIIEREA